MKKDDSATVKPYSRREFIKMSGLATAGFSLVSLIDACSSIVYVKTPIYIKNQREYKKLLDNIEDIPELKINNSKHYIDIKKRLLNKTLILGEKDVSYMRIYEQSDVANQINKLSDLVDEYSILVPPMNRAAANVSTSKINHEYAQIKIIVNKINTSMRSIYKQVGFNQ
ncbi:MAG: hypothetical protein ABH828_04590 [archaeon]